MEQTVTLALLVTGPKVPIMSFLGRKVQLLTRRNATQSKNAFANATDSLFIDKLAWKALHPPINYPGKYTGRRHN